MTTTTMMTITTTGTIDPLPQRAAPNRRKEEGISLLLSSLSKSPSRRSAYKMET